MTLKKMLLLATMALVALGLVAPAAASAGFWWYDHKVTEGFPPENTKKEVSPKGELSITVGTTQLGPCTYHFNGFIWNNEASNMGVGEFNSLSVEIPEPCSTNKPNCTVTGVTGQQLPWSLTLTNAKKVAISGIKLHLHLSKGCEPGVPATTTVTGAVEGTFIDAETKGIEWTESIVEFSKAGGLSVGGTAATLDGTLKFGTWLTGIWKE